MFMDLTLRMVIVYAMPEDAKQAAVRDTVAALEAGRLQHRIAQNCPSMTWCARMN
jgi:NADPH2:quinone reductase